MLRGGRLKQLRERSGYTHADLSEMLNIGFSQVYRYESGKADPSSHVLERMAKLFGVSVDYLLGLTDDPIPDQSSLSHKEKQVIAAWRRGERFEAIKMIVVDDES